MKTQFKINSATETAAIEKMQVVEKIKEKCGLTQDVWLHTLFETGCQFVEKHISRKQLVDALLMNKDFGFWDWWLTFYIQDDETLLDYRSVQSPKAYGMEKQRLFTLFEAESQFDHFLNANRKLNGTEF